MHFHLTKQEDSGGFIDQEGCWHESVTDWFWCEILGGCGCGQSDGHSKKALELFRYFSLSFGDRKDHRPENFYSDEGYQILAHWFYNAELTEHGTSVNSSWLSEKGKEVLQALQDVEDEQ